MNAQMRWLPLLIVLGCSFSSCSNADHETAAAESLNVADSSGATAAAPAADGNVPELNSPERKLIHTANLHAEVKDLYEASAKIETATLQLGGQVTNSSLHKELLETKERRSGSDSVTSIRRYQGLAQLSLRIPVARLDTLLKIVAAQTVFIDNRQLHIDDATYRYLANAMKNKQFSGSETTVPGVAKRDGLEARQYLDGQRGQSIDRQVENMQTTDLAAFASLAIDLTGVEELVAMTQADPARAMQPGPGARLLLSLRNGWDILYELLLGLLAIWPICLLAGVGLGFAIRRHRQRQQRARVS